MHQRYGLAPGQVSRGLPGHTVSRRFSARHFRIPTLIRPHVTAEPTPTSDSLLEVSWDDLRGTAAESLPPGVTWKVVDHFLGAGSTASAVAMLCQSPEGNSVVVDVSGAIDEDDIPGALSLSDYAAALRKAFDAVATPDSVHGLELTTAHGLLYFAYQVHSVAPELSTAFADADSVHSTLISRLAAAASEVRRTEPTPRPAPIPMSADEAVEALQASAHKLGAEGWSLFTDADGPVLVRTVASHFFTVVLLGLSEILGQSSDEAERWVYTLAVRNDAVGDVRLVNVIQRGGYQYFYHAVFFDDAPDVRLAITAARLGTTALKEAAKSATPDDWTDATLDLHEYRAGDSLRDGAATDAAETSDLLAQWAGDHAAAAVAVGAHSYRDVLRRIWLAAVLLGFRRGELNEVGEASLAQSAWLAAGESGRSRASAEALHHMLTGAGKNSMLGSPAERVVGNLIRAWRHEAA